MFASLSKITALTIAALFSTVVLAVEPLRAISVNDEDYDYYSAVAEVNQKLVNEGMISNFTDFDMFNVRGRIVDLADGSLANPYNLVITVNGNLYYVDAIMSRVTNYKIRRRWVNNPEPGVFLRIQGTRINTDDYSTEKVTLWIKIATPEGRALPMLKVLEGNFDL